MTASISTSSNFGTRTAYNQSPSTARSEPSASVTTDGFVPSSKPSSAQGDGQSGIIFKSLPFQMLDNTQHRGQQERPGFELFLDGKSSADAGAAAADLFKQLNCPEQHGAGYTWKEAPGISVTTKFDENGEPNPQFTSVDLYIDPRGTTPSGHGASYPKGDGKPGTSYDSVPVTITDNTGHRPLMNPAGFMFSVDGAESPGAGAAAVALYSHLDAKESGGAGYLMKDTSALSCSTKYGENGLRPELSSFTLCLDPNGNGNNFGF